MVDIDAQEREARAEWLQPLNDDNVPRRRRRLHGGLPFIEDTAGEVSWRKKDPPAARMTLPKEFAFDDKRARALQQSGKGKGRQDEGPLYPELRQLGEQTGTFIAPSPKLTERGLTVEIWGDWESVKKAKDELQKWVDSYTDDTPLGKKTFARTNVISTEMRTKIEARLDKEVSRDQFRRTPPENVLFPATAMLEWPSDYDSPQEVVGKNMEAYDVIRTWWQCYITYDPQQRVVNIMGHVDHGVKDALIRVRTSIFQSVARARPTTDQYLIQPLSGKHIKSEIHLVPFKESKGAENPAVIPRSAGPLLKSSAMAKRSEEAEHLHRVLVRTFTQGIKNTLKTLTYYRGRVKLQASLGTFVLTNYRKKYNQKLPEFENMMDDEQVSGEVAIADRLTADQKLLTSLAMNMDSIRPAGTGATATSFRPTYSAAVIMIKDNVDYKLGLLFENTGEEAPVTRDRTWARARKEGGFEHKLLNSFFIDIEEESAWDFEAIISEPSSNDSRFPVMSEFAGAIEFNDIKMHGPFRETDDRFLSYKTKPGLFVKKLIEKQSWEYFIKDSPYVIEVSKVREFKVREQKTDKPNQYLLTGDEAKWNLTLTRSEWDSQFMDNVHLPVGEGAKWKLDEESLFPSGVEAFLSLLEEIRLSIFPKSMHGTESNSSVSLD